MAEQPRERAAAPLPQDARVGRPRVLEKPITLSDLTEELLWPRLLRVVPLALRPERMGIAFFTLVIVGLLARIVAPLRGGSAVSPVLRELGWAAWARNVHDLLSAEFSLLFGIRWEDVAARPQVAAAVAVPAVVVLVIGLGAIARMAACEFSQSVVLPWPRGLGFALGRVWSLLGAVVGPLIVAGGLLLAVALAGGAFFNWSVSAVAGALLYPLALILCGLAVVLMIGYMLAHGLLIAAVAVEGTDAIDAAQRAYAYVVGRPLRLLAYLAVLYGVLVVAGVAFDIITMRTVELTARAAGWLAGPEADPALGLSHELATGDWAWAGRMISFWTAIPRLLVGAFVLSYGASASAVLYLVLRKLTDGQDTSEIWMPGMVGGTMAPVAVGESEPAGDGDDL